MIIHKFNLFMAISLIVLSISSWIFKTSLWVPIIGLILGAICLYISFDKSPTPGTMLPKLETVETECDVDGNDKEENK